MYMILLVKMLHQKLKLLLNIYIILLYDISFVIISLLLLTCFYNLYKLNKIKVVLIMKNVVMVFNTTFNNMSVILWRSVLLVAETGVPGENHRPAVSHWHTLSHALVSSTPRHERDSNPQL